MQSQVSTALLISPFEEDYQFLRRLFLEKRWILHSAVSLQAALLRETLPSVVITEAGLRSGNWRSVVGRIGLLPDPPLVIVAAFHADEHLWAEALNLGAYDVLSKPFDPAEVFRVLGGAWCHREKPDRKVKGMGA